MDVACLENNPLKFLAYMFTYVALYFILLLFIIILPIISNVLNRLITAYFVFCYNFTKLDAANVTANRMPLLMFPWVLCSYVAEKTKEEG